MSDVYGPEWDEERLGYVARVASSWGFALPPGPSRPTPAKGTPLPAKDAEGHFLCAGCGQTGCTLGYRAEARRWECRECREESK
jgi:hypothetical protein